MKTNKLSPSNSKAKNKRASPRLKITQATAVPVDKGRTGENQIQQEAMAHVYMSANNPQTPTNQSPSCP